MATAAVTAPSSAAPCCTPLAAPLKRADAERLAVLLKAAADPTRLQLLSMVASADGAACVCDLTAPLGLTQPTISHHLKVLVDAGLLDREQRGVWAYYSLIRPRFEEIRALLDLS